MKNISRTEAQGHKGVVLFLFLAPPPCLRDSVRVRSAFSLIELLVVIAIIGLLMTAAVPALNSVLENGRLTQAAALLVNQFTLARQRASAENKNITLRFIRKDTSSPYDRIQDPNPAARDALRVLINRSLRLGQPARSFVNNRFEGNAPATIESIVEGIDL